MYNSLNINNVVELIVSLRVWGSERVFWCKMEPDGIGGNKKKLKLAGISFRKKRPKTQIGVSFSWIWTDLLAQKSVKLTRD